MDKNGIGDVEGLYFMLPNVARDGTKGQIIEIKDSVTIAIDVAKIMHGSTWTNKYHLCNI